MEIWTLISTQDYFKASWSLHKSVHLKAKQSNGTGNPENEGWQYRMKKGQGRTPKLPYFDWTGRVYKLTGLISLHSFKEYQKLSKAEKVEWNNWGFSIVHAIAVAVASFYLILLSDTFHEGYSDELIVSRRSTFSYTTLGISIGYFLADIAMIFWHFPALGGLEYVLHHGLSMFSIFLSLVSGEG
ncbi:putative methionyl aminopeptidase [Rosa chinensis]|uniref:Putative methionyl aminopeptidase n=1 Tax=Rosa chinensis TaxID=74649 RepID=A0A2P6SIM0_ROSCH|nr:putative methionyl aminopeptidase [Rosa chinensis]